MALNLAALTKDKRLLVVGAAGGALGLVTLLRKRNSGSQASAPASTGTAGAGYTPGYLGSYDSAGIDAYNNINNEVNGRLDEFGRTITGIQSQLAGLTPSGTSQSGSGSQAPAVVKSWKAGNTYTADSVARRFGVTVDQLQGANPGHNVKAGVLKGVSINVPVTATNSGAFTLKKK